MNHVRDQTVCLHKLLHKTTYELLYEGKSYSRCYSELHHYNSDEIPQLDPIAVT